MTKQRQKYDREFKEKVVELSIARNNGREVECEQLASSLYCKGLTQFQVGEVFGEVYGKHYSKASISRMIEYLRTDVEQCLTRSLESYYPIILIDATHIKVHRKRSVENEAFYVVMGVREAKPGRFLVYSTGLLRVQQDEERCSRY